MISTESAREDSGTYRTRNKRKQTWWMQEIRQEIKIKKLSGKLANTTDVTNGEF